MLWQPFAKLIPVLLASTTTKPTIRTTTTAPITNDRTQQHDKTTGQSQEHGRHDQNGELQAKKPRWPPRKAKDLTENFKDVYRVLEQPGPIYKEKDKTLRFSYVTPPTANGTSTWRDAASCIGVDDNDNLVGHGDPDKPIALYLPGLDGYGISAFNHQFDDLARTFELWRMTVLPEDRSSLSGVVRAVSSFVREHATADGRKRKVVLIGESCGGVLAAAAAVQILRHEGGKDLLKGLVLVNPATSFDETIWDYAVPAFTSLKHLDTDDMRSDGVTPYSVLGSLFLSAVIPDFDQFRRVVDTIMNLPEVGIPPNTPDQLSDVTEAMLESFRVTGSRLPPEVLEHRVGWLISGTSVVNSRLGQIDVPSLVVVGEDDKLLPSNKEADRLVEALPTSEKLSVRGRGHFVLDENVNLTEAILYSKIDPLDWQKKKKKFDPVLDWKPPSKEVLDEVIEKSVKPLKTAVSPMFFSTDQSGKRWKGLVKVPRPEGPLLIVANHQFAALDLRILAAELLEKKGIFPRGLAHPVTFIMTKDLPGELSGRVPGLRDNQQNPFNGDFQKFGAVEVNPLNYYKMMQSGQDALLFPGGAKEALTSRKDYPLFWPEKTDFVRTAARFNATILPLSAVGMLESVNVIAEPEQLARIPFIRDRAKASPNLAAARYDESSEDEMQGFPLALPKLPARNYFIFGKPITTKDLDPMDKEACASVYREAQAEVRRGIDDLIRAREKDPFKDPVRRLAYERVFGKEAPTFPVAELN